RAFGGATPTTPGCGRSSGGSRSSPSSRAWSTPTRGSRSSSSAADGAAPGRAGLRPRVPVRIAVHDHSGHAFQAALSRELARRGHDVLHLHNPAFLTGKGRLERQADDPPTLTMEGI